jgi:ABC-type antimicrobial peptide transport system permease subunit
MRSRTRLLVNQGQFTAGLTLPGFSSTRANLFRVVLRNQWPRAIRSRQLLIGRGLGPDRVAAMLTQDRLIASLSVFGGALALLLAAVGLYGVTAYTVACRRAEFGLRIALGSTPARVVRLVLWQTLRPVAVGLVIGSALGAWAGKLVDSLLYGVTPRDPLVMITAVLAVVAVALVAAWTACTASSTRRSVHGASTGLIRVQQNPPPSGPG